MKKTIILIFTLFILNSCGNINTEDNLNKLGKTIPGAIGNTLWKYFSVSDSKNKFCNDILDGKSKFSGLEDIDCKVEGDDFVFSFKVIEKGLEDRSDFFKDEYICGDNNFYGLLKEKTILDEVNCEQGINKTDEDINLVLYEKKIMEENEKKQKEKEENEIRKNYNLDSSAEIINYSFIKQNGKIYFLENFENSDGKHYSINEIEGINSNNYKSLGGKVIYDGVNIYYVDGDLRTINYNFDFNSLEGIFENHKLFFSDINGKYSFHDFFGTIEKIEN